MGIHAAPSFLSRQTKRPIVGLLFLIAVAIASDKEDEWSEQQTVEALVDTSDGDIVHRVLRGIPLVRDWFPNSKSSQKICVEKGFVWDVSKQECDDLNFHVDPVKSHLHGLDKRVLDDLKRFAYGITHYGHCKTGMEFWKRAAGSGSKAMSVTVTKFELAFEKCNIVSLQKDIQKAFNCFPKKDPFGRSLTYDEFKVPMLALKAWGGDLKKKIFIDASVSTNKRKCPDGDGSVRLSGFGAHDELDLNVPFKPIGDSRGHKQYAKWQDDSREDVVLLSWARAATGERKQDHRGWWIEKALSHNRGYVPFAKCTSNRCRNAETPDQIPKGEPWKKTHDSGKTWEVDRGAEVTLCVDAP